MRDKRNAKKSRVQLGRDIETARKELGLTHEEFAKILWNRHTMPRRVSTLIQDVYLWEARGMSTKNRYFIPCCEELGLNAEDYMSQRRLKGKGK